MDATVRGAVVGEVAPSSASPSAFAASAAPVLPEQMAPLLALIEALPASFTERLLIELLACLAEPTPGTAVPGAPRA